MSTNLKINYNHCLLANVFVYKKTHTASHNNVSYLPAYPMANSYQNMPILIKMPVTIFLDIVASFHKHGQSFNVEFTFDCIAGNRIELEMDLFYSCFY